MAEPIYNGTGYGALRHYLSEVFRLRDERCQGRFDGIDRILIERDHRYDQRFRAQQDAVAQAMSAADTAIRKAEVATEKRLENVNEWRAALEDYTKNLATKTEVRSDLAILSVRLDNHAKEIDAIKLCTSSTEGRHTGIGVMIAYIIGATGIVVGVISLALRAFGG